MDTGRIRYPKGYDYPIKDDEEPKKIVGRVNMRNTEQEILDFIKVNGLGIDYIPERDTKKYALAKIKEKLREVD